MYLQCGSEEELRQHITCLANQELHGAALERALEVELVSGQYATYATIKC